MTRSAPALSLGSEFDTFLWAPIGVSRNGMPLSVLSALARAGVDPWQEAAKLAGLPREAATEQLASIIAALPDGSSGDLEPRRIAASLIGLLPRRGSPIIVTRGALVAAHATTRSSVVIYAISLAFVLGFQYMMASRQLPPQADDTHISSSSTGFVPKSVPGSGQ
jgi:hypothetical protein